MCETEAGRYGGYPPRKENREEISEQDMVPASVSNFLETWRKSGASTC